MTKVGIKTRDFQWYSHKNGAMVRVHSKQARDYGKHLEAQENVQQYEAGKALELERFPHISPTGIRKSYLQSEWCSDFYISFSDGHAGVRELVAADTLQQQATVEKLELSRRYWVSMDITDWKVVVV